MHGVCTIVKQPKSACLAGCGIAEYPDVVIYGLQSDIRRLQDGEMYCCDEEFDMQRVPELARQALTGGASALILPDSAEELPEMQDVVPDSVPVFYVESVDDLAVRLAVAFYGAPSRNMLMIHMLGSKGKTTTAWLIRGILEEMQQVSLCIASCMNAILRASQSACVSMDAHGYALSHVFHAFVGHWYGWHD